MLPDLPEEIIELILSYAPNFRDNLKKCQNEQKRTEICKNKSDLDENQSGLDDFFQIL